MSYSIADYVGMIADEPRTSAYARALRSMITPESVVLDLGAGFGFFAVLAAKLGARHAFAVEIDDAIGLGPALANANGVADRVTFLQGDSRKVILPERANVLVEDVRGILPLHRERIKLLADARERLLTADVRCVVLRDHLFAAPSRQPDAMRHRLEAAGADVHGLDLRTLRPYAADVRRNGKPAAEDLLLPGALLGTLDLSAVADPYFEGTARWSAAAPLSPDGFAVWFDVELAGGERFSSKPGPRQTSHGCLYLPLPEPLDVPAGAELSLRFCGVPAGDDYAWVWECAVSDGAGRVAVRTPRQASFRSNALSPARLAAMSMLHRPALGLEGERLRQVLALIDGKVSSTELAVALTAHPRLEFGSSEDAQVWLQQALPWIEAGSVIPHKA